METLNYRRIRIGRIGRGKTVCFAVSELVKYLKRMDPELTVDVLFVDKAGETVGDILWVGRDETFRGLLPRVEDCDLDDGIGILVQGYRGCITGTNDRSVLIAVYRFLRELGCAFVRPGRDGERIPSRPVENLNVHVTEAASYRHRGVCIEGADSYENVYDMIDYLPKVGLNEYFIQFLSPCDFFERWYLHRSNPYYGKEEISREEVDAMTANLEEEIARRGTCYHKTGHGWTCEPFGIDGSGWRSGQGIAVSEEVRSFLAQVDGKRDFWGNVPLNTNLCYSNRKVRDTMTQAITDYCVRNPEVDVLHFWLADGSNNQCECENCRKMRPADWYVRMLNELDDKLTKAGVKTRIVFLIYVDLLWEPVEETLLNPDRFIMMFAPISRSYGQNYSDCLDYEGTLPDYERNHLIMPKSLAQNLEHLRRWQKKIHDGALDSFAFEYHLMWEHYGDPGYEKCAANLFQDVKDLHGIGLNGLMNCQVQRCFFPTALPFHMMSCALWNEKADFEKEALAYYRSAFGEDGVQVRAHLKAISAAFLLYGNQGTEETNRSRPRYISDYTALSEAIAGLKKLAETNMEDSGSCKGEWENLSIFAEYAALYADYLRLLEEGTQEEADRAGGELIDFVRRREQRIQKVFDLEIFLSHLKRKLKRK